MADFDHLFALGFSTGLPFKSNLKVVPQEPPQRERQAHGEKLLRELARLRVDAEELNTRRAQLGLNEATGMTIVLEISPPGSLDLSKKLEWRRDGIEVLSSNLAGGTEVVALYVPDGKLSAFEQRIRDYLTKDNIPKDPTHESKPAKAALVNAIESFRRAAFDELWTDESADPPPYDQEGWVQIWLRRGSQPPKEVIESFSAAALPLGVKVEPGYLTFPGRVVVAAQCTRRSLEQALYLLDQIAEMRSVRPSPEFFLSDLKPREQADWIQDLQGRLTFSSPESSPYVTLLDTGVNDGHVLLSPVLDPADLHAVHSAWGKNDHHGHGTEMAGLAIYGDLTDSLSSSASVHVPHRLESVKILPPRGSNPPHLYGFITATAVNKVELSDASRPRVFATMTTAIGNTSGLPTEWSATVDQLAFGLDSTNPYPVGSAAIDPNEDAGKPRLFVAAAGNVDSRYWSDYPNPNLLTSVEDPGQAWNILTVGAYTDLTQIDQAKWPSVQAIAPQGGLAPSSTTSVLWKNPWPLKPDVVAEGGNSSLDRTFTPPALLVGPESLRLLTTSHQPNTSPLAESGDTSGAAAEVARLCAHIRSRYPQYWEETIRALVIHGARHTNQMLSELPPNPGRKTHKKNLLRKYGYGSISFERSLNSGARSPTLVVQDTINPYALDKGSIKLNQLKLHELPWPKEELQSLGGITVAMRVTLSYFIEPNPSRRGWQSKYRYQSHGLRFAVKSSLESESRFKARINQLERDQLQLEEAESMSDPDRERWEFGANLRSRGSVHSDVWTGTGAQLAEKSHVAVYPVGGWWKDWNDSHREDVTVRYSMTISIEVLEDVEIDIYTPIKAVIEVANAAVVEIERP